MLTDFTGADRVIIACGRTDLRLGIDGLAALVKQQFRLDPFTCQRREKNNVKRRVEIDANAGIMNGGYLPPVNCPPESASAERL